MRRRRTPRRGRQCPGHASGPPKPISRRSRSSTRSSGPLSVRREDQTKPAATTDAGWRRLHEQVTTPVPTRRPTLKPTGRPLRKEPAKRPQPERSTGTTKRLAVAHHTTSKGSGAQSPQVSPALLSLPTGEKNQGKTRQGGRGKNKGKTRQGVSAANFLLAPQVLTVSALFGLTADRA